jgi:hypothetical protein
MSNYQTLVDTVATVESNNTTAVGITRTRATLLTIKKLTDIMRKELLAEGKQMKKPAPPTPPTPPVSPSPPTPPPPKRVRAKKPVISSMPQE